MILRLLPLFAVISLVLASVSVVRTQPRRELTGPPSNPPTAPFVGSIAAVGLVEPSSENISIAPHLPGVVSKVNAVVGQSVRSGDPLVQIDDRHLRAERGARAAELEAARARIEVAAATLADQERQFGFVQRLTDANAVSAEEVSRRRSAVEIAQAQRNAAMADARLAQARLEMVQTEIERSIVRAPIDGRVLQVRIRAGEYAPAAGQGSPWLVMGAASPLHVRADVDEHEAWRVRPGARAEAQVRGNSSVKAPLRFVRIEPLVVPKASLTGVATERVDTRVLQVVYAIEQAEAPFFVGQQVDVFIESTVPTTGGAL